MQDQSGNSYREIPIESDALRLTFVPSGWNGKSSVRIQMKDASGHLRLGPEVPIARIGEVIVKLFELIADPKVLGNCG